MICCIGVNIWNFVPFLQYIIFQNLCSWQAGQSCSCDIPHFSLNYNPHNPPLQNLSVAIVGVNSQYDMVLCGVHYVLYECIPSVRHGVFPQCYVVLSVSVTWYFENAFPLCNGWCNLVFCDSILWGACGLVLSVTSDILLYYPCPVSITVHPQFFGLWWSGSSIFRHLKWLYSNSNVLFCLYLNYSLIWKPGHDQMGSDTEDAL